MPSSPAIELLLRCGSRLGAKRATASNANQGCVGSNRDVIPRYKTKTQLTSDLRSIGIDEVSGIGYHCRVVHLPRTSSPKFDSDDVCSSAHLPRTATQTKAFSMRVNHMLRNSHNLFAHSCSHLERTRNG